MKRKRVTSTVPRGTSNRTSPFVLVNMAMTADGKIASANRAISSFGSPRDQEHLLELRATADAVMAGARTVDLNPINMGPGGEKFLRKRAEKEMQPYNVRIIVSRLGTVNPQARVFQEKFSPVLVLTTRQASASRLAALRTVAHEVKICGTREINFRSAFRWLFKKWKIRRLVCEGGGELNDALFQAGLVDELHLTVCPWLFAGRTTPTIAEGTGAVKLGEAAEFEIKSSRRVGDEMFLCFARRQRHRRNATPENA
jgi:5-amino-6-(5-phosphoribosylamino)uracil reductase